MDVYAKGDRLLRILKSFGVESRITNVIEGAVYTVFEVRPEVGVKLSKLKGLASDLELNLPAKSVRVMACPEKSCVAIEVANDERRTVWFRELLDTPCNHRIPFYLGRDAMNDVVSIDIADAPHLLIGGSTGSGKSVCVNNLICSILAKTKPEEVGLVLVDPKIVELSVYNGARHLIGPVITEFEETIDMLQSLVREMERRYETLRAWRVRNIAEYNAKACTRMKYIVVVMDEFADFMAFGQRILEPMIAKLTSMARAVGIHLVLSTQRPSVDVVTGLIKANIPSRIAFQVSSATNSRIILDCNGAEKLLGKGDMLLSLNTEQGLRRVQGAYLDYADIQSILHPFNG